MTYLLSSVVLALGPLVLHVGRRYPAVRRGLNGFILATLAGIVALHIVPQAWQAAGASSLLFLLLGGLFPVLLERVFARALNRAHLLVLALAVAGIGVHAVLDGIALLPVAGGAGDKLALGVIVHRLPVGMAIWWALSPRFGVLAAVAVIGVVIVVTGVSFVFGEGLTDAGQSVGLAYFQSFVAGSLVHVALFGSGWPNDHSQHAIAAGTDENIVHAHWSRTRSWSFRVGLLVGLVVLALLPHLPRI